MAQLGLVKNIVLHPLSEDSAVSPLRWASDGQGPSGSAQSGHPLSVRRQEATNQEKLSHRTQ